MPPCFIVQAFKRDASRTIVLLVSYVLVTSSSCITLSDKWCAEHRFDVFGLSVLLHDEFILASDILEASYSLRHSHPAADVSLNYNNMMRVVNYHESRRASFGVICSWGFCVSLVQLFRLMGLLSSS